jgi:hypothetical protein
VLAAALFGRQVLEQEEQVLLPVFDGVRTDVFEKSLKEVTIWLNFREEHETLQGSLEERLNIVVGFTNMFRNFNLSAYNLGKHFDYAAKFRFFAESPEVTKSTKTAE